jgi:hypothetical protein
MARSNLLRKLSRFYAGVSPKGGILTDVGLDISITFSFSVP